MNDVETTNVLLTVNDNTRTTHVTTTSDHNDVAGLEVNEVDDLVLLKVKLDCVVDLDGRVRVPDGAAVVGDDVGYTLVTDGDFLDFEELEGRFLGRDAVHREAALDIIEETEVLAGLLNRDNV
jgi:hypothetical protein